MRLVRCVREVNLGTCRRKSFCYASATQVELFTLLRHGLTVTAYHLDPRMEPLASRLVAQAAPRATNFSATRTSTFRRARVTTTIQPIAALSSTRRHERFFSISKTAQIRERTKPYDTQSAADSSYSQPATGLSQNVTKAEKDHFSKVERESKAMQSRSPWTRDGSDVPPVQRSRSAGAMTKGKLLTTPSRMLKLILPLTTRDHNNDRKDVEPLALLVHPQQPLSYLERLIQSELPFYDDEKSGKQRPPNITFRAEDSMEDSVGEEETTEERQARHEKEEEDDVEDGDEEMVDGKRQKTGVVGGSTKAKGGPKSNEEPVDPARPNFVKWSPSTEIGDFIRDAARGKEFAVDIEGAPEAIYVGVPSFNDRTYYLRMRLRKTSARISSMAQLKSECDELAHRGAKNVARLGFAGLIGWWGAVYYLTFLTDLGWDVMEPVTYLVGLSGLIGGYMWFLYHNREVSYKSAMNFTVSRRQGQLYQAKGFDLPKWEMLIEEGNRLRREVKMVAEEYDVDWDETKDEGDEKVREALRKERKKKEAGNKEKEKDNEEEKDD
ncbi:Calcium uniporter protein 6, mitochondrial [Pseudocercospora fuligena]|uniref:Calcium uniporter protein, mitochondrial n=1 Tax=Pseudocercospora fuligena TaxID=685502 RepID=A0A8H6RPS6_9PEZI|nr:Calcium uniporter protein 6, mitochondrial [Pseudocercospora fuligena]